jgi:hypothetical protein
LPATVWPWPVSTRSLLPSLIVRVRVRWGVCDELGLGFTFFFSCLPENMYNLVCSDTIDRLLGSSRLDLNGITVLCI